MGTLGNPKSTLEIINKYEFELIDKNVKNMVYLNKSGGQHGSKYKRNAKRLLKGSGRAKK